MAMTIEEFHEYSTGGGSGYLRRQRLCGCMRHFAPATILDLMLGAFKLLCSRFAKAREETSRSRTKDRPTGNIYHHHPSHQSPKT
jgi:hypothetical protein